MNTIPKLALLLPMLAATPVLAQGTEAQRAACGPDAFRLCASSIPDPGRTAACLKRERERLSGACRAVFDEADASARTAAPAARPESVKPRAVAAAREAAPPSRVERGRRVATAAPRLPRQADAAATPRERPARAERRATARVVGLDRPARATSRAGGGVVGGGFADLEAQAHGWHRTLAGYADTIERRFARLGGAEAGRFEFGRLPGL